jgi:hypothetical protein
MSIRDPKPTPDRNAPQGYEAEERTSEQEKLNGKQLGEVVRESAKEQAAGAARKGK